MRISVFRKEHFNAAHRLHNPAWSDEKNRLIFGKCNNPKYHGHNYDLVVEVAGEIDPETGYLIDMKHLSDLIGENILDKFDKIFCNSISLFIIARDFADISWFRLI